MTERKEKAIKAIFELLEDDSLSDDEFVQKADQYFGEHGIFDCTERQDIVHCANVMYEAK